MLISTCELRSDFPNRFDRTPPLLCLDLGMFSEFHTSPTVHTSLIYTTDKYNDIVFTDLEYLIILYMTNNTWRREQADKKQ